MKGIITLALFLMASAAIIPASAAQTRADSGDDAITITPATKAVSGCGSEETFSAPRGLAPMKESPDDVENGGTVGEEEPPFYFTVSYSDAVLTIKAYNVVNTCGLVEYNPEIKRDGNELHFVTNMMGMADCLCIYNVEATFEGIEPGHYTLRFDYREEIWEIDLEEGANATFDMTPGAVAEAVMEGISFQRNGDMLTVLAEGDVAVTVTNASGVCVNKTSGKNAVNVSLAGLPAGWYAVKAKSATGTRGKLVMR